MLGQYNRTETEKTSKTLQQDNYLNEIASTIRKNRNNVLLTSFSTSVQELDRQRLQRQRTVDPEADNIVDSILPMQQNNQPARKNENQTKQSICHFESYV